MASTPAAFICSPKFFTNCTDECDECDEPGREDDVPGRDDPGRDDEECGRCRIARSSLTAVTYFNNARSSSVLARRDWVRAASSELCVSVFFSFKSRDASAESKRASGSFAVPAPISDQEIAGLVPWWLLGRELDRELPFPLSGRPSAHPPALHCLILAMSNRSSPSTNPLVGFAYRLFLEFKRLCAAVSTACRTSPMISASADASSNNLSFSSSASEPNTRLTSGTSAGCSPFSMETHNNEVTCRSSFAGTAPRFARSIVAIA
mmetsp:Transcript_4002/g.14711  ORF Transcript_4002/g.14711 Transcript_4002/m.14711 type:complete len:264 (+) Transcript_4002:979-1770(+)